MPIQIPLKRKYLHVAKGRFKSTRSTSGTSKKKLGSSPLAVPYQSTHVLILGADMKKRVVSRNLKIGDRT